MCRAGVLRAVHPVTEPRNFLFPRKLAANDLIDPVATGLLPEVDQHPHHLGIGSTMEGPLEGADPGDDGRVEVTQGRSGHARGEGRGIQLMLGMQHQRHVERPRGERAWPVAGQQIEEAGGVSHRRVRLNRPATGGETSIGRYQTGNLSRQAYRRSILTGGRRVSGGRVEVGQGRGQRTHRIHRIVTRQTTDHPDDRFG